LLKHRAEEAAEADVATRAKEKVRAGELAVIAE